MKVSLEQLRAEKHPASKFLCKLHENTPAIQFLGFSLIDRDKGKVYFSHQNKEVPNFAPIDDSNLDAEFTKKVEALRHSNFRFPKDVLTAKNMRSVLKLKNGPKPIQNLVMLEKHFFRGEFVTQFEFHLDALAPHELKEWVTDYQAYQPSPERLKEILAAPGHSTSDTFLLANGTLIAHHKASYVYE